MLAKNRRTHAGDIPSAYEGTREKHHVQTHQTICQDAPPAPKRRTQPQPEEDLGGGDICSLQEQLNRR
jgi:hypothetical protein